MLSAVFRFPQVRIVAWIMITAVVVCALCFAGTATNVRARYSTLQDVLSETAHRYGGCKD